MQNANKIQNRPSPQFRIALLGSGRLGKHLQHYLSLIPPDNFELRTWSHREDDADGNLRQLMLWASHVWLAVRDDALAGLASKIQTFAPRLPILVHFSGATVLPHVIRTHPLMTFGPDLRDLQWYKQIPFAVEDPQNMKTALPVFSNPTFLVADKDLALYHSLCATAGNSIYFFLAKVREVWQEQLHLPKDLLRPYLHQIFENALADGPTSKATGPIARQDWQVVDRHLNALKFHPQVLEIYETHLRLAKKDLERTKSI